MKSTWIRPLLCATLLVTSVNATESGNDQTMRESKPLLSQEQSTENRVPIGDRRVSMEEHLTQQEKRCLLAEERAEKSESDLQQKGLVETEDLVSKAYYTSHEGAFHRPISITIGGDMVTLEDGSVWKVRAKDKYKTLDWLAGDSIVILPNHSWFSTYYYVLLNQNTGEEVRVNLVLGPIYNGIYTHWIVAIDYYNQEVCLEDGSIWKISGSDYSTMKKWLVTDTIIIGVNDSWFSNKPNILINVNTLTYSAAVCEN